VAWRISFRETHQTTLGKLSWATLPKGYFISHIGEKSFHQRYEIKTLQHTVAVAKAVLVWFNFDKNQSVPIPEDKRALMREYMPAE
jgi:hypothetical protein